MTSHTSIGGNPTLLVKTPVKRDQQPQLAKKLLQKNPSAEQAGFIERANSPKAVCRLQMAGGEFCGNAARALGILLYKGDSLKENFIIESSGFRRTLVLTVKRNKFKKYLYSSCSGKLKFYKNIYALEKFGNRRFSFVKLQGITQILIPGKYYKQNLDFLSYFQYLYKQRLLSEKAAGLIFYFKIQSDKYKIIPVVYVRALETVFVETSCVSGSLALAIGLKKKALTVLQKSRFTLKVDLSDQRFIVGGRIKSIKFSKYVL